ncbi:MAG: zinc ribbon domain-containing protein [Chloroflexi bacterium]|nr:zinc ribbon domain-containing protein [Chloroflexota bacterium]
MPFYEFECPACHSRAEVFARTVSAEVAAPKCATAGCRGEMVRVMSKFARHLTAADQLAEAEAKWGKQVNDVMGPEPDVGRLARRYDKLAKDLPPPPGKA